MKQKIVIKVQMPCDKCRSKAMKIASKANGVNSVAIEGSDRDQLVVIGEGVDSANLTCSLRKKLCYATLRSVEEVKDEQNEPEGPEQNPNPEPISTDCPQLPKCPQYPPYPVTYEVKVYDYTPNPSYCPIM
ncbi:heavy metal-associated isoprenylated plant protein 47-like [Quercus robur]|uniref:heavy metal-associated isoprenylated plant protein 47-like n=1 Tax=Quercus robur TaxID=38942 RepID=UPI002163B6D9|nr:heavy metal-associated isoprenylated plant protein 47-like [Quercus robur]